VSRARGRGTAVRSTRNMTLRSGAHQHVGESPIDGAIIRWVQVIGRRRNLLRRAIYINSEAEVRPRKVKAAWHRKVKSTNAGRQFKKKYDPTNFFASIRTKPAA